MASLLPPTDLDALRDGMGEWLHNSMVAALTPGYDGWLDDDLAFVQDWGFALSDVRVPVLVMAGGEDLMVPVAHGEWLASHLPDATRDVVPEAGHFSLLAGVARLNAWLLHHW
jgi:pimeloyl-ACP methyl ester carboxylesterase